MTWNNFSVYRSTRILNANKGLAVEVLFSRDTINEKTVLEVQHEKHPQPFQSKPTHFFDTQTFNSHQYHQYVIKISV